jgi:hypothetical protein
VACASSHATGLNVVTSCTSLRLLGCGYVAPRSPPAAACGVLAQLLDPTRGLGRLGLTRLLLCIVLRIVGLET